jgi:hypothetical protein
MCAAWIARHNHTRNIYFSINKAKEGKKKKTTKADIGWIVATHVDVDINGGRDEVEEARIVERLRADRPTLVIFSGGGYQGIWRFADPLPASEDRNVDRVELLNKRLARRHEGDVKCWNIDRVMRLVGTTNWPDVKKRAKGRVPGLACVVEADWERLITPALPAVEELDARPERTADTEHTSERSGAIDKLPKKLREWIKTGQSTNSNGDRSAAAVAVACELVRQGWADDDITALLTDPEHAISAHARSEANPGRAARRAVATAHERIASSRDEIDELNEQHAVVRIGNKVAILMEFTNEFGGPDFSLLGPDAFKLWLANRFVTVTNKKGAVQAPVAEVWLHSSRRRQYNGIVFSPGKVTPGSYNIWAGGFAVEPGPGDCSLFLDHILHNVSNDDAESFRWNIGWFAEIFQKPSNKSGTSLVLRGESGVGKTFVFEAIGGLLGPHYQLVDDDRYVTGRFNSHMARLLLMLADEAFWAGDKGGQGRIRSMITGERHPIELKGYEPIWVSNHMRLGITGNKTWMAPALMRDRRFCIRTVSERNMQDTAYFGAILKQLDEGGRAGLLRYLLEFELSTVDLRQIPRTEGLLDSVLPSMNDLESWWFSVLSEGELPRGCPGERQCTKRALYRSYLRHAKERNGRGQRSVETEVGRFLKTVVPAGMRENKVDCAYADNTNRRERAVTFPHLGVCRKAFEKKLGQAVTWPGWDPDLSESLPEADELDFGREVTYQEEDWEKTTFLDAWDDMSD